MVASNPSLAYGRGEGKKEEIPHGDSPLVVLLVQFLFLSVIGVTTAFVDNIRDVFQDYCLYLMTLVLVGFASHVYIAIFPNHIGKRIRGSVILAGLTISYVLFYAVAVSNHLRYASSFSIPIGWALAGFTMSTACVIPWDLTGLHGTVQLYVATCYACLASVFLLSTFLTGNKVYAFLFSVMSVSFYIFVQLEHVKETMNKKTNPLITLSYQAVFTLVFLIFIHASDDLNMRICQYAVYFLVIILLASVILYSVILCFPNTNEKRSKIMIYALSFCFGAVYLILGAVYYAGVSILSYLLSLIFVGGVLYLANIIPIDITNERCLIMIFFGVINLLAVPVFIFFGFYTSVPLIFFCGGVFSFFFSTIYLFVNCQYCGLYVGEKTKVRKVALESTFIAHPIAYLYVGSLTVAIHLQPLIHQLWKLLDGRW